MNCCDDSDEIQTLVIGAGQAGLSVGYYLAQKGIPFQILDASPNIGDAWRNRWDSLRLFTQARYAGLPGMNFPAEGATFPTKEQVADYLADYARRFCLPVRHNVKVDRLWTEGGRFVMTAGKHRFEAENVVVAMANYQTPSVPAFARDLNPQIVQFHSHAYRSPLQLQNGGVLVVGVGNSGAEIALEVARSHATWLSGKETAHIPWPVDSAISRYVLSRGMRFFAHHILTVKTRLGRKVRPRLLNRALPLARVKPKWLIAAGVKRVPRVTGVTGGLPTIADGRTLDVKNVIWCTGYRRDFPWIDLPIFNQNGEPIHEAGIVEKIPGMYFVGLHFLYSATSATLLGVGRDAERIVGALARRTQARKTQVSQGNIA